MTTSRLLIDTGPLVALYDRNDQHHKACTAIALVVSQPVFTCWPVITEAAYLLRHSLRAVGDLLTKVEKGQLLICPIDAVDATAIKAILDKYHFDLADACLMHLANRESIATVFTVDHRHFSLFRTTSGQSLRILPELTK